MKKEEFKILKDIEIKFHRLILPVFNSSEFPLNGIYNPIDNMESSEYPLNNKFFNFDMSSNECVNIDNLFSINTNHYTIYSNESFEGFLIIINKTEKEIKINDFKLELKNVDEQIKNLAFPIEVNIPDIPIIIQGKNFHSLKIKSRLNYPSDKYMLEVTFFVYSQIFDQFLNKSKQKSALKNNSKNFRVINGSFELIIKKNILLKVFNPFKIEEIFHNFDGDKCLIEVKIFNVTSNQLSILDLFLTPKEKENQIIPCVQSLEEIKCNKYGNIKNDTKYLILQPEEQIIVLFEIENTLLYSDEDTFLLNISWIKYFDFNTKLNIHEIKNNFNTYNKYYRIAIVEKPNGDIIFNKIFKIVINLQTKNLEKIYTIYINEDKTNNDNKSNEKEIKIIDFVEKKILLNSINPSANFTLICKSENLGSVSLPKLRFGLYEDINNPPIENYFDPSLSFNCILNVQ